VATRHVAFAPRHPLIHRLKYTRTCHGIIAVSDAVRDVLIKAGVPGSRVTVIHTGVELPPETAARTWRTPRVVGHLGAFTSEKGQDIAIEAARLLPDVRFILAGDGPMREDLRRRAPKNVEFPGFLQDTSAFFEQIDLFIMPSRSEAWGLAAIEAIAHGVPVIASDIQGLAEIVESGKSGWLVPPDDPSALARAIAAAYPLTGMRDRAAQFSVETMARQTEAFYRRLLDAPGKK
jgi:glycosyltransferase involved in cell wall biosynthesis